MIDAEQFNRIEDMAAELMAALRESIIELMVQRIMAVKYDTLIESNRLLAYKLQASGMLLSDIVKVVARRTGKSRAAVKKIFEDSYVQSVKYDNKIYEKYGIEPLPFNVSEGMLETLNEAMRQTEGELHNMTRTLADSTQTQYIRILDEAYMKVRSGAFSYTQAISDAVSEAIKESAYIHYTSGHKDHIEVATRRAVLCGVNQSSIRSAIERCRERGWNHICVSSHLGARTAQKGKPAYADHSAWQGKVYWLDTPDGEHESFVEVCGWGHGDGIGGWGCRHSAFAWVEGMGNPFEQYNSEENRKRYELVRKQRAKERRIREIKIELVGLRKAIDMADSEELKQRLQEKYDKRAAKLREYNKDYKDFCEENQLKTYHERLKTAEWSAKESRMAVTAANREARISKTPMEKSDDSGYTVRNREEFESIANGIKQEITQYSNNPSKWSGKIIVNNSLADKGIAGQKEWDCNISLVNTVDDGVIWHEMLHSCSASYYAPDIYVVNKFIEEATVEFLKQQICKEKGIESISSYTDKVFVLKSINKSFKYGTDLEFAKEIFSIPLPERYQWLENKVDNSLREADASFEDYNEVMTFVEILKGRENE